VRERDPLILLCAARPARAQHPVVECNTDHAIPRGDGADRASVSAAFFSPSHACS
jgi:hypothetical protein